MEEETGFLSKDEDDKIQLQTLLGRILSDLNEHKVTTIVGKLFWNNIQRRLKNRLCHY